MKMKRVMMKMENYPLVKDVFPIVSSIFSHCDYDFGIVNTTELDSMFFTNYGLRNVSPLVTSLTTTKASDDELRILATTLVALYKSKWDRLKALYTTEYDPIHNYFDELTENVEDSELKNSTSNNNDKTSSTSKDSSNTTRSNNLTRTEKNSSSETGSGNDDSLIYGFNSSNPVHSNSSEGVDVNTYKADNSLTSDENQTNTTTNSMENSSTRTFTNEKNASTSNSRVKTSTHKGNIGNLTSQQMIKQEIELRQWNFIQSVLEDAKELLTIPMYL